MTVHVLFLQPRGNQPSWPTDPVPTADAGAAPPPGPDTTGTTTTPVEPSPPPSGEITQETCQDANRSMLIAAGGYNFGAVLVGLLLFLLMRKKLWSTVFGRYLTAILVAGVIATALAGWDPVRQDVLQVCLNTADVARYIFLHDLPWARALVLGLVPSSLLTLLACFVANRT